MVPFAGGLCSPASTIACILVYRNRSLFRSILHCLDRCDIPYLLRSKIF